MDWLIVDAALVSFIVLVIGLMVMPERRSSAAAIETATAATA